MGASEERTAHNLGGEEYGSCDVLVSVDRMTRRCLRIAALSRMRSSVEALEGFRTTLYRPGLKPVRVATKRRCQRDMLML